MYEYVVILVVIGSNLKVFIHSILQTKNSKQIQIDRYRCFLCACVFFFVCVLCHFWKKYSAQLNWKDNIVIKFESHVKSNWIVFSLSLLMLDIRRLSLLCQFSHPVHSIWAFRFTFPCFVSGKLAKEFATNFKTYVYISHVERCTLNGCACNACQE